jgi:ABC-type transporter Mla subunit MlaD
MAQRRSLAWTELRVGILVITSFALLALAIFYVGGQRGFFVKTYTVNAYFQNANNLRDGAEVYSKAYVQSVRTIKFHRRTR